MINKNMDQPPIKKINASEKQSFFISGFIIAAIGLYIMVTAVLNKSIPYFFLSSPLLFIGISCLRLGFGLVERYDVFMPVLKIIYFLILLGGLGLASIGLAGGNWDGVVVMILVLFVLFPILFLIIIIQWALREFVYGSKVLAVLMSLSFVFGIINVMKTFI